MRIIGKGWKVKLTEWQTREEKQNQGTPRTKGKHEMWVVAGMKRNRRIAEKVENEKLHELPLQQ